MFVPNRDDVPTSPGVYLYKDFSGEVIYVGKAKNLRNRVMSYFSSKHNLSPKTKFLVKQIVSFEFIAVDNEVEALLLENRQIKKYKPKYNIDLKDGKSYAYIKLTDDDYTTKPTSLPTYSSTYDTTTKSIPTTYSSIYGNTPGLVGTSSLLGTNIKHIK